MKLKPPKVAEFWKHDQISEADFFDNSDDFDILLFQSNHSNAKFQRFATRSEFGKSFNDVNFASLDHAAIITRLQGQEDDVWFLEATGDGVWFKNWAGTVEKRKSIRP